MNDAVLFPAIQFRRDKSAQGFNAWSPVQFRSSALGRQEMADLLCDRRFYGQFVHQDVEIRGNDTPTPLNPVHRQDGAQDVEVFLDPHHVALEIFPVISPRHVEVMIGVEREFVISRRQLLSMAFIFSHSYAFGYEGKHQGIEADALLLGENSKFGMKAFRHALYKFAGHRRFSFRHAV